MQNKSNFLFASKKMSCTHKFQVVTTQTVSVSLMHDARPYDVDMKT
jgi:hypothetical protein